jgi:hypothetical protein
VVLHVTRGRRRHGRRRQRGSALVLAVLILFAMIGLGLLAMRTSTQNIAGSGNLRMNKQAQYIAELALHHAVTLMQQDGENLLRLRGLQTDAYLEVDSSGRVTAYNAAGNQIAQQPRPAPPLLGAGPTALGQFGQGSGLVPSYRVRIDGFTPGPPLPGYGMHETKRETRADFCLMHFSADGYVAAVALPTEEQLNAGGADERFAEHRVSAAIVLGPYAGGTCKTLAPPEG